VSLSLDKGTLTAKGKAPYQWIIDARRLSRAFPGITKYRDKDVTVNYEAVLERIKKDLATPETVSLKIVDGVLWASGSASHQWIVKAREFVGKLPEIRSYRDERLKNLDAARLAGLKAAINRTNLHFDSHTARLISGQEQVLSQLVTRMRSLQAVARSLDRSFYVDIKGHTSATGWERDNVSLNRLGRMRASKIYSYLVARGINGANLSARGVAGTEPMAPETSETNRALNRRVSFNVIFLNTSDGRGRK
jgi:outer membrane protein OmpA-like peptidoglycan-associated protein